MANKPKKWIRKAVAGGKGAFSAKADRAGKTTKEFAAEHADAPGKLGKEARLAKTLAGMSHKRSGDRRERMYPRMKKG